MANISQANTTERSLRSVFVGNIPYDASEEKLKDIFSEAGPVLSFKLVYDRDSGKPKGYGFCEYRDQETALSAMRNLNSYELNGRNLRVDTATNERFKEEIKSLSGSTFDFPYGSDSDGDRAPEQIAKVVSNLPPEQMFEIAKQMKHCVLTNPNEARNMLLQNPQLAYALLQLLVVMRAVDINMASSILYKPNPPPIPIPAGNVGPVPTSHPGHMVIPPQQPTQQPPIISPMHQTMFDPHEYNRGPQNFDQRHLDPRLRQNEARAQEIYDPRIAAAQSSAAAPMDPRLRGQAIDPRHLPQQPNAPQPNRGPANAVPPPTAVTNPPPMDPRLPNLPIFSQPNFQQSQSVPPTAAPGPVPVSTPAATNVGVTPLTVAQLATPQPGPQQPTPAPQQQGNQINQSEAEKAQLIMQVLSLSNQQINMLPADQRQSILLLRQQLQQQNK